MHQLLTIGLPTFNRSQLLDQQLAWLAQSIQGFESKCEIIISDNCSTDNTPEVIKKWQSTFANTTLKLNRNSENIGPIRNIAYCIGEARNRYVWTISDDDLIYDETLAYILNSLTNHPDLTLLTLNFCSHWAETGRLRFERCFKIENNEFNADGKTVFENCLEEDPGGLALTSANVYRTELAQQALQEWPSGFDNLNVQIYWTGFCAFYGSAMVTKDVYLDCTAGTHFFVYDPKLLHKFYVDDPEMYAKLIELGYSSKLCRRKILESKREGFVEARIMQKDCQITKLEFELAKKQYKDGEIPQAVLDQKAADYQDAEYEFQLLTDYLPDIKELFRQEQRIDCENTLNQRDIQLIIFPDWSHSEDSLFQTLAPILRTIAAHPDKNRMILFVDTNSTTDEAAKQALSNIVGRLFPPEALDDPDGPAILLTGKLSSTQWQILLPRLQAHVVLEQENKAAIAAARADKIPVWDLESFSIPFNQK